VSDADLDFYLDPVCPFCWMTSRWVRLVAQQRGMTVRWRFISLRLLNAHVDYDAEFPPEYEAGHTAGLRLLRVLARARAEHGEESVGRLYEALGTQVFERDPLPSSTTQDLRGTAGFVAPVLAGVDLPEGLVAALDDDTWDGQVQEETDRALSLAGKDVGTPILHFRPPEGVAFFGPVISRLPDPGRAVELWDHVVALAEFPGFAELKRSLRELPQLSGLGVAADEVGVQEDWHGGSRRQKR
jgi:2-hydroxychromene-2-carboxylate isomerase